VTSPVSAQARPDAPRASSDSATPPARQAGPMRQRPDSVRPPISPPRAFLYSFFLPGLGQARLQRHAAGAIYTTVEAIAIGMAVKSANDLRIARQHQRDAVVDRYRTNPATGEPVVDDDGNFIPADTAANRNIEDRVKARRTHFEDWIAALLFNHLFSGADAFVAAHLWDLPARVGLRPAPGGAALTLALRW
jgi:hypothetical protein